MPELPSLRDPLGQAPTHIPHLRHASAVQTGTFFMDTITARVREKTVDSHHFLSTPRKYK
jgi:hypothetical protein